jgi:hypothetical protein
MQPPAVIRASDGAATKNWSRKVLRQVRGHGIDAEADDKQGRGYVAELVPGRSVRPALDSIGRFAEQFGDQMQKAAGGQRP